MIKTVHIQDFQSLHDVTADLGAFTVLLGESDLGKSAFIRAIHAAATNQTGQDFIRHGAKHTQVTLDLDDHHAVEWKKAGSATYRVWRRGDSTVRPAVFEKARGVPSEVSARLRLDVVTCGDVALLPNIHTQFSMPFLVADTPSTRAKVLGELSGINQLFAATQEARRREAAIRRTETQRLSDIAALDTRLSTFADLDQQAALLSQAASAEARRAAAMLSADKISAILSKIAAIAPEITALKQRTALYEDVLSRYDARPPRRDPTAGRLDQLVTAILHAANEARAAKDAVSTAQQQQAATEEELALVRTCPSCGRPF